MLHQHSRLGGGKQKEQTPEFEAVEGECCPRFALQASWAGAQDVELEYKRKRGRWVGELIESAWGQLLARLCLVLLCGGVEALTLASQHKCVLAKVPTLVSGDKRAGDWWERLSFSRKRGGPPYCQMWLPRCSQPPDQPDVDAEFRVQAQRSNPISVHRGHMLVGLWATISGKPQACPPLLLWQQLMLESTAPLLGQ